MKELRYSIHSDLYEIASKPIRNRYDLLRLLSLTLKSITIQEDTKEIVDTNHEGKKGEIIIHTERMSRIFYYLEGKQFSFHFPFYIEMNGELQKSCIYKGDTLVNDALITSVMVSIICNEEFVNISFSDLRDYIGEIIETDYAVVK